MIKYLVMDIDGSLTDGKIYMGQNGEVMKAFSIKDGMVINYILKPAEIVPVVITARTSAIVQNRCDELGIKKVYQGKLDKLTTLKEIAGEDGLGSCAYFGDDTLDLRCMLPIREAGGIAGCPADAVREVKAACNYVCLNRAGEGALREFAEWLIAPQINQSEINDRVNKAVAFLQGLSATEKDAGRKVIVDDSFYYSVQLYETKPEEQCKLESHRKYIDIQLMVYGEEFIDVVDTSRLKVNEEYSEEKDVMFWNIPDRMARTTLRDGDYIVLYPENAHRGAVSIGEDNIVFKLVGKVKL